MAQPTITTDTLETFHIAGYGSTEITLHQTLPIQDNFADVAQFLFAKFLGSDIRIDAGFFEYAFRERAPYPINIAKRILDFLSVWNIYS